MTTLEQRHYVATPADIERMASEHDAAFTGAASTRGLYLRVLVATTQSELGIEPRERAARAGADESVTGHERAAHLEAFERVHARFYPLVLRGLSGDARERNRKSGFARSAASTLRRWIRAGHHVGRLAAVRVTRDALEAAVPAGTKRAARIKPGVLKRRGERGLSVLVGAATAADRKERGSGVAMLQSALSEVTAALVKLGGVAVARSADAGVRDAVPFKSGGNVFWPVGVSSDRNG